MNRFSSYFFIASFLICCICDDGDYDYSSNDQSGNTDDQSGQPDAPAPPAPVDSDANGPTSPVEPNQSTSKCGSSKKSICYCEYKLLLLQCKKSKIILYLLFFTKMIIQLRTGHGIVRLMENLCRTTSMPAYART